MFYESTRGKAAPATSAEAIKMGIAPDGGLFVPDRPVKISREQLAEMAGRSYRHLARDILQLYLTDFSAEEIVTCVTPAYGADRFADPAVAPVRPLDRGRGLHVLELFHGPTCAFKDFALQILPHLLTRAMVKTGENKEIAILVATSGDTGKAALEGFKDVPGTRIIVFYPAEGVSEIQKLQMVTQEGGNVHVIGVRGNFDHAQNGVKEIFGNRALNEEIGRAGCRFSSANSINWGRLLPQIVYYFFAYLDLLAKGELAAGEEINFVVPTGNFGNILAAFYARRMGLPVHRLVLAANRNNVLTDFIRTGIYDRNRPFYKTISPSMDILISSNLERLLFELTGRDGTKITAWMEELKAKGRYRVDAATHAKIREIFWSDAAGDTETMAAVRHTYQQYGYLIDPHTAVGMHVYERYREATGDRRKTIVASTASPFKFNQSVVQAVWGPEAVRGKSEFALLEFLAQKTGLSIPPGLRDLNKKPVRHTLAVEPADMAGTVRKILSR
ncbi:MAG: threonine synthase [Armatimonadetes bacterium]|nr:threonine synthase [Armatimonadota bacterium]